MIRLPNSLKMKIIRTNYTPPSDGTSVTSATIPNNDLIIFLDKSEILFCLEWMRGITSGIFKSFGDNSYKVDVGPYKGVWIYRLENTKAIFSVDYKTEENWKDWFIEEGEDAPSLIT